MPLTHQQLSLCVSLCVCPACVLRCAPSPGPSWPATMQPPLPEGAHAQALALWESQLTAASLPLPLPPPRPSPASSLAPGSRPRSWRSFYPQLERSWGPARPWRVFGVPGTSSASSPLPPVSWGDSTPSTHFGERRSRGARGPLIVEWRSRMLALRIEMETEREACGLRTPVRNPAPPPPRSESPERTPRRR